MSDELRESIAIAIEVLVFSIILLIISFFGTYSRNAFTLKQMQDLGMVDILEYRNIYEFSMGKEITKTELKNRPDIILNAKNFGLSTTEVDKFCNVVTGDDIVRLVGLYPNMYSYYIYNDRTSPIKLVKDDDDTNWSILPISTALGEDIGEKFYCLVVYDDATNLYDYFAFTRVEG